MQDLQNLEPRENDCVILSNVKPVAANLDLIYNCLYSNPSPVKYNRYNNHSSPTKRKPTCLGKLIRVQGNYVCTEDNNHTFQNGSAQHCEISVSTLSLSL